MIRPKLFLNHDADYDWLIALEFGRVDDGQPSERWSEACESLGYLDDGDGRALGFKVLDFSTFDPEEVDEIWDEPRFAVPVLGLPEASAGEIVLAARPLIGGGDTINRSYFGAATGAVGEEAARLWLACLEAGDQMAHFGLGYTLYDLGRFHEAYRHLRHYAEIAPAAAWNWVWLGKAAEAIGEYDEARLAYERALEEEEDDGETDAEEHLDRLLASGPEDVGRSGRR